MQDDWLELLPFAGFVHNKITNELTKKIILGSLWEQP